MMAPATGAGAAVIDFRDKGEGREYLKKLIVPIVIVLLLAFIVVYALARYGPERSPGG